MKNADALFLKLRSAYARIDDEVPTGYKCSHELGKLWNLSKSRTNYLISLAVENGALAKVNVYKNSRVTPYYGPPIKNKSTKAKH